MISIRTSEERGFEDKGWLETFHTFSFDTYFDPDFMHYRSLRVINEDVIKGGKGFGMHPHKDIEVITYVLEGALEHKDSLGNTIVIGPQEVMTMSAGSGISHSEYNLSHQIPVRFLQIWIDPEKHFVTPTCTKRLFTNASKWGQWCLICSRNGREGSLRIQQDVDLYATILDEGSELQFNALADRFFWIQIVSGKFQIQEMELKAGDAIALEELTTIDVKALEEGELLLFDLP